MTPTVQKVRSQIASNAEGRGDDQDGDVESRAGGSPRNAKSGVEG